MKESTVPAKREQQVPDTREQTRSLVPPVDIFESKEGLVVVADLPGADKSDVDVRVENDTLTLQATAKSGLPIDPLLREYELHNYHRQFQLGETVDQEKIKAEMKHGVLVINLPKKEAAKPRKITVKTE